MKDAPVVSSHVRLSTIVTSHDAADAKTMRRAETLKSALGADFQGEIDDTILADLKAMTSSSPIEVVDLGNGHRMVTNGNGRIQAMKLAFEDHTAVNVAVHEVQISPSDKTQLLEAVSTNRVAMDGKWQHA